MSKVKVYRVENKDGHGPYHRGFYVMWESENKTGFKPNPNDDELIMSVIREKEDFIQNYLFGFARTDDFLNWFNEDEIKNLQNAGFFLKEYEVPRDKVIFGNNQVIFKK